MERVTYPNGLKLLLERRPKTKTVAITLAVKAGTVDEEESNNGVAHFIEHIIFEGTKTRTYNKLMNEI